MVDEVNQQRIKATTANKEQLTTTTATAATTTASGPYAAYSGAGGGVGGVGGGVGGFGELGGVTSAEAVLRKMKETILIHVAELVVLDRIATVRMVAEIFPDEHKVVLSALESAPQQQHHFLRAVAQGEAQGDSTQGGVNSGGLGGGDLSMASYNQLPFTLDTSDLRLYVQLMAEYVGWGGL